MSEKLNQQEIVETVKNRLKNVDLTIQATGVMKRTTGQVLDRIKKDIDAQVQEVSSPIIENFINNTSRKMNALTQQWVDGVHNELTLFPEGTRYIWRDGSITTVIVEQQPKSRIINIYKEKFLISLPYVQFIISFKNNKLIQRFAVTCTKKPMSDLDQAVNYLPLGNVNESHIVCMGDFVYPTEGTTTKIVGDIIQAFWQSEFTYDHGGHMLEFLQKNNFSTELIPADRNNEVKIKKAFEKWAEKTVENPLFSTDKSSIYKTGSTFRRFLTSDSGDAGGTNAIISGLKKEITAAITNIGGDIQKILTNVDLSAENRDKTHQAVFETILKDLVTASYTELYAFCQRQLIQERQKLQEEMKEAALKLKNEFVHYMEKQK